MGFPIALWNLLFLVPSNARSSLLFVYCECMKHIFHVSKVQDGKSLWLGIHFYSSRTPSQGFGLSPCNES